jgi:aminopeptidase-like protein
MSESSQISDLKQSDAQMFQMVTMLYPICRSITGNGFRESLQILEQQIPIEIHEVPTGTQVFDWTVPKEWNIHDAYIKDESGEKVIDFNRHNLHILNYSIPVNCKMPLSKLKEHLFTIPEQPELIPYKTSYYKEDWGFCLSHNDYLKLGEGEYEVVIDSTLEDGSLTYGECFIQGESDQEILISCHSCHPSMCNDNLSGMVLATFLAKELSQRNHLRYSYRFLFIPGTIGSITWLALHEDQAHNIQHGLVVASVGDAGKFHYKRSRRGNSEIDQVVEYVLSNYCDYYEVRDFSPYGYDERQYCSPGFDLPVGCLTRTPYGEYPQYHTSADDLNFVSPQNLAESFDLYMKVFYVLENNHMYLNTNPKCEAQLGKRGLYSSTGGGSGIKEQEMAYLWILNLSDGNNNLLEIARRSGFSFEVIKTASDRLKDNGLLTKADY